VVAPPGLVVNVDYPGPEVAGNTETSPAIAVGAGIGAVEQVRVQADLGRRRVGGGDPVQGGLDLATIRRVAAL